jgi:hypothetical protein
MRSHEGSAHAWRVSVTQTRDTGPETPAEGRLTEINPVCREAAFTVVEVDSELLEVECVFHFIPGLYQTPTALHRLSLQTRVPPAAR